MQIRQIRNATLVLEYGGKRFLVDPFFAGQGTIPAFPNTPNQDKQNPLVGLPVAAEELVKVDAVFVTHLHLDHFDDVAKQVLPKDMPIYTQNEEDAEAIRKDGFAHVQSFEHGVQIGDVLIAKTDGQHGTGEIGRMMGNVSGIVYKHPDEQTLYIAGDTIWCDDVQEALEAHNPGVIVVNGGAAQFLQGDPITMTKEDIYQTYEAAPQATIVVSHMEALNHCLLTRAELKSFMAEKVLSQRVVVPEDGEVLQF
ncbi:MBL fold metallo-hydrolase [Ectobacillus sp. JY-23]|uniref:MBL fold metallo-hydrolase n=1 Tax=Ectobacillus sp. JY-23 TaxID=2933872 RepID=UPI001FF50673|nr:MBL fold metallo-hydrolase [Ectobacillus sp. JY-23]UOY92229.1 MBL fold metallo-hydrolase [Ectobacillus sp. JY-23]